MANTQIGSTIGKRYTVIEKLGEGGMSVVWLARDQRLQRLQAIKEIKNNASDSIHRVDVDLMRKEAHIMKDLDHPNIVHVHDIIDENDALYVVMDYVPGKDLHKVMRENCERLHVTEYAYPEEDVIDWGKQLCSALGYLHQQEPPIIYRDMKPGNVMLQDDGQVKIIDFGIAREFKPNQSLDTTPLGTRGYASPEAVEKASQTDARSDVYSLGVTLFHLVTGISPLKYATKPNLPAIRTINPSLSPALEAIITKATQWEPEKRQQTMAEFELELELLEDSDVQRWMKRTFNTFRGLLVAAAVFLVAGIGCLAGSHMVRESSYAGLVEQASHASNEERGGEASEAEKLYTQAIELNPRVVDQTYIPLVNNVYIADDMFSQNEESRWNRLFNKYQSDIIGTREYAQLCYCAGLDYMFYLETSINDSVQSGTDEWDESQDELERGRRAAKWFEEAIASWNSFGEEGLSAQEKSLKATAESYLYLGQFASLIRKGAETDDRGSVGSDDESLTQGESWRKYFDTLSATVDEAPTQDSKTIVKLRLYHIAARALAANTYVSNFKNATPSVTAKEMTKLVSTVRENTTALYGQVKDDTKLMSLYDSILTACDHADMAIEKVYGAGSHLDELVSGSETTTTSAREGAES